MIFENRNDYDLAEMLKFENIAWYNDGAVSILDRRVYPIKKSFVICKSYTEVAQAIKDMVTQSEGPYIAACHGIVLAVYEAIKNRQDIISYVQDAAIALTTARPTTKAQMVRVVKTCLDALFLGIENNYSEEELLECVRKAAYEYTNNNYAKYSIIGKNMAELIQNDAIILTQCFGGTIIGTMLRACRAMGKNVKLVCAETRPYYQGSRLTASVASDMGFDVTVITDNMVGAAIQNLGISVFISASDVITCQGDVVNKVGTMQMAMLCKYFNVPYYCTGTPDIEHPDLSRINIEQRDPELVLKSLDTKITMEGVKGFYPAFDITPNEYVSGIVTEKGVFKPNEIYKYFK